MVSIPENDGDDKVRADQLIAGGYDLQELALGQDFQAVAGVKKLLTTIPVRKPDRHSFFRINPDPDYQLTVGMLELKAEREFYIVLPDMLPEVAGEYKVMKLACCLTRQNTFFIWPLNLPGPDGRINPWHQSALDAAGRAEVAWVRMAANQHLGAYEIFEATGELAGPEWPGYSMNDIVNLAFKNYIIDNPGHPVLRQLRGEI